MSVRNLGALFRPGAIALFGGEDAGGQHSVGAVLAQNLLESGFKGPILPVDAERRSIRSVLTYPSVAELPLVPDLAVIATPPDTHAGLVEALGARGCRAAILVSGGFAEPNAARRQDILDAARPHMLRIVGPNCLGILSPSAGINASFALRAPKRGQVAFLTQSGLIATAVLDWAAPRGIGFSHVVSLGDMADVDFGDMLDVLESDAETRIILLYVEGITAARKFLSAARIAARTKPVVVVKAGRGESPDRAGLSHTAALAGTDAVYDAAFRRAGMLRVETLDELFQAVATLSSGLRVEGDRLAIIGNGGGLGIMAGDAVERAGGRLAALPAATLARLGALLRGKAEPKPVSESAPIDLHGDADGARYVAVIEALLGDKAADAVLVLNCPTALADRTASATAVAALAARLKAPVLTCWLGGDTATPARRIFDESKVATYETPERAVKAFAQLDDYRRNQDLLMETPGSDPDRLGIDRAGAAAILCNARAAGQTVLTGPDALDLLAAFAVPVAPTAVAKDIDAACRAAEGFGFPVALKILSPDIAHKSDVGGVHLTIGSADVLRQAARDMLESVAVKAPEARVDGFIVQPMLARRHGRELVLGIAEDAVFGPVVLFGDGGTAADLIADRVVGLPPLNDVLALDMIRRTRVARLLGAFRERPAADLGALALTLVKLSHLATEMPDILELDINPLLADASGVVALDARILLRPEGQTRRPPAIRPYPRALDRVATTRRGVGYRLRPIRPEDEAGVVAMLHRSSRDDVRLRFFAPRREFGHSFAARLTQVDYDREMALVALGLQESATRDGPPEINGVVRLIADPDNETAEFAVMVRSDLKGTGLGSLLMTEILDYAKARGIAHVRGEILRENTSMLRLVKALGFKSRTSPDDATVMVAEIAMAGWEGKP